MPTYRAIGIEATLQVTDLLPSLPANIHKLHCDSQRQDAKRIEDLFRVATDLPERALPESPNDRPSLLRFVGERKLLVPLLICEAGQHIPTARIDPAPISAHSGLCNPRGSKREQMVQPEGPVHEAPILDRASEPESSPLTSLAATPSMTSVTKHVVDEDSRLSSLDTIALAEMAQEVAQPIPIEPSCSTAHDPPITPQPKQRAQPRTVKHLTAPFSQLITSVSHLAKSPDHASPKAMCVTVELSDKAYLAGKNPNTNKKDGNDFQVEIFVNGELAGSCYVTKRVAGTSAVEMVNGRLVFRGRRVHRQVEAAWIYIPKAAASTEQAMVDAGDSHRRWTGVSEALAAEANSRGWDGDLGLAPPSADFLRGLSKLPIPAEVVHTHGLGIVDVVITAGVGKKASQVMGHIREPTWLTTNNYSVNNQEIIPKVEISAVPSGDGALVGGNGCGLDRLNQPPVRELSEVNPARSYAANVDMINMESVDPDQSPSLRFDVVRAGFGHVSSTITALQSSPEVPLMQQRKASMPPPRKQTGAHTPTRKRRKLMDTSGPGLETSIPYWDMIARFDISSLDPSKIDLGKMMVIETTRSARRATRTLSARLLNLRQMSSPNRERQVNDMEAILGQSLLDMLNNARRKDSGVTSFKTTTDEAQRIDTACLPAPNQLQKASASCSEYDSSTFDKPINQTAQIGQAATRYDTAPSAIGRLSSAPLLPTLSTQTSTLGVSDLSALHSTDTGSDMEPVEVKTARSTMALGYGAPDQGHLIRMLSSPCLAPSNAVPQFTSVVAPNPAPTSAQHSGPTGVVMNTLLQPAYSLATNGRVKTERSEHPQPSRSSMRARCQHEIGFVTTHSPPRMTEEERFQAINAGHHPATSSTSTRLQRKARGQPLIISPMPSKPAGPTPRPIRKSGTACPPTRAQLPKATVTDATAPEYRQAMNDFAVPELSRGSAVGYSETEKMFRHTGKARHGEFKEREVVVGFRFCVL